MKRATGGARIVGELRTESSAPGQTLRKRETAPPTMAPAIRRKEDPLDDAQEEHRRFCN